MSAMILFRQPPTISVDVLIEDIHTNPRRVSIRLLLPASAPEPNLYGYRDKSGINRVQHGASRSFFFRERSMYYASETLEFVVQSILRLFPSPLRNNLHIVFPDVPIPLTGSTTIGHLREAIYANDKIIETRFKRDEAHRLAVG